MEAYRGPNSVNDCDDVRNKAVRDAFLVPLGYGAGEGWQIGQQGVLSAYQVYVYGKIRSDQGVDQTWERDSEGKVAYLISINTIGAWQALYAQTLPDMLQILALLSPIIEAHAALSMAHMLKHGDLPVIPGNDTSLLEDEDEQS